MKLKKMSVGLYLNDVSVICKHFLNTDLGQFTRNYTQTVKRAADNKRRYAPGWVHTPMDEETADLFKQLAKKMMKGIE